MRNPQRAGRPQRPAPLPPAQRAVDIWAQQMCNAAVGVGTADGFKLLGPVNAFTDLLAAQNAGGDPRRLLAAEQLSHLIEGWRYASSAIQAFLNHSTDSAIHLAYYAELRAVSSLYAWSGIRASWGNYFYLDAASAKRTLSGNPPTHEAVWALWKEWVKRADVGALLGGSIKLHPLVSLDAVVAAIKFTRPQDALQSWGADLVNILNDRKARNDASYQAGWIGHPLTKMVSNDTELVRQLWRLLLTEGTGLGFDAALCNYFVEEALKREAAAVHPPLVPRSAELFRKEIASHISGNTGAPVEDVFQRIVPTQHPIEIFALAGAAQSSVENVLARCFTVLRMALLATKQNLEKAAPIRASQNWLSHWLEHAGLWMPGSGVDPIDIEIDYRNAVDDLAGNAPLPMALWDEINVSSTVKMTRPDACLSWGLLR